MSLIILINPKYCINYTLEIDTKLKVHLRPMRITTLHFYNYFSVNISFQFTFQQFFLDSLKFFNDG